MYVCCTVSTVNSELNQMAAVGFFDLIYVGPGSILYNPVRTGCESLIGNVPYIPSEILMMALLVLMFL
ncbi:hypothetical protein F5Y13DRAFT_159432 [Hypoxylon sp. FL1857]|nr:hypothetical protein F5Y13DRAFT_159432 [Hypoxylon sp. FL1857]